MDQTHHIGKFGASPKSHRFGDGDNRPGYDDTPIERGVERVGNRIRELRERLDMTQEELAERCGTTAQTISRLETGARELRQKWMEIIAPKLGVLPSALLPAGALGSKSGGEFVNDADELALLHMWRELDDGQRYRFLLQGRPRQNGIKEAI